MVKTTSFGHGVVYVDALRLDCIGNSLVEVERDRVVVVDVVDICRGEAAFTRDSTVDPRCVLL